MTEPAIVVTFGGSKAFDALRRDQQVRVSSMMLSWHRVGGFWYDRMALRRAIRKVLNNHP
jgi:hypothetical protein